MSAAETSLCNVGSPLVQAKFVGAQALELPVTVVDDLGYLTYVRLDRIHSLILNYERYASNVEWEALAMYRGDNNVL